jgi:pimeloyl-ACP methyl ester carboxylesterase
VPRPAPFCSCDAHHRVLEPAPTAQCPLFRVTRTVTGSRRGWWPAGALGVAVVLSLAACGPAPERTAGTAEPSAAVQRFHEQELAFGSCDGFGTTPSDAALLASIEVQCGHVEVPIDHADPGGATARVAVSRIPARSGEPAGSVVVNGGGPGVRGVDFAAILSRLWSDSPITEKFDIVGFDPRGVGATEPAVDCHTDAERDADALPASIIGLGTTDPVPLADRCAASVGGADVLAHLGTRDVARDLDVLRAVLDEDQLTYLGLSYGTRLGAVYAEMFPDRVGAMVLDGGVDPRHTSSQGLRQQQFAGFQRAFDTFAAACAANPACPLGTDPARSTQEFQQLVRPLAATPARTSDGRELTYVAATDGLLSALYVETLWPQATAGLAELRQGRGDSLMALRDSMQGRLPDGTYSDFLEATYAISCADDDHLTPEENAAALRSLVDAAPFLAPPTPIAAAVPDDCAGWPERNPLGYPYAVGVEGLPDVLVVSVTGDASTPHEGGISLAETLGGSLLTVEGNLHGATIVGDECVDATVATYLVDGVSPEPGTTCRS